MEGVICDFFVVSRNMGGFYLFIFCYSVVDDRFLKYSREVVWFIKISFVKDGVCREKFYILFYVVFCMEDLVIELELCDGWYFKGYDLELFWEKFNEVLKLMVIILVLVLLILFNKLGVSIMNFLIKE